MRQRARRNEGAWQGALGDANKEPYAVPAGLVEALLEPVPRRARREASWVIHGELRVDVR